MNHSKECLLQTQRPYGASFTWVKSESTKEECDLEKEKTKSDLRWIPRNFTNLTTNKKRALCTLRNFISVFVRYLRSLKICPQKRGGILLCPLSRSGYQNQCWAVLYFYEEPLVLVL